MNTLRSIMVSALNMEPYIMKKGAVNPEEDRGRKRFEDFVLSSSMLAAMDMRECYSTLNDVMFSTVSMFGKTRMWGAMEILFPWAYSQRDIGHNRFVDYLKEYTTRLDVRWLMGARNIVWRKSNNPVKMQYLEEWKMIDPVDNVWDHYRDLEEYGEDVDSEMISVWAREILKGLPTVKRIKESVFGLGLYTSMDKLSEVWTEILDEQKFSVGQLADYTVLVIYDKIVETYHI